MSRTRELPVGALLASALMAAGYGGDSGEDVDRLIAEMAKRGLRAVTPDRLARARHRWQHPTFAFAGDGGNRCGCLGWAATIGDMLSLLESDERDAEKAVAR